MDTNAHAFETILNNKIYSTILNGRKRNMFEIMKKAHMLESYLQESDAITSLIIYTGN